LGLISIQRSTVNVLFYSTKWKVETLLPWSPLHHCRRRCHDLLVVIVITGSPITSTFAFIIAAVVVFFVVVVL